MHAANDIVNLGPPNNAIPLPPESAIGFFHRVSPALRDHGKPEILFIGTQVEGSSAAETWPVVKALQQFGTLGSVSPITTHLCTLSRPTQVNCHMIQAPPGYPQNVGYPTLDLDHARYRSRYITFVHRDLIDRNLHLNRRLSGTEFSLFNRYARMPGYGNWADAVWHSALDTSIRYPGRQLPLLDVYNYAETASTLADKFDLEASGSGVLLPFATVQESLQSGHAIAPAPPRLVTDFNKEANVITALICHADHLQPASVCTRSVIKSILKHVK